MIRAAREHDGGLLRLTLDRPPGNVLHGEDLDELALALAHLDSGPVRAVLLDHAGTDFSFGASVEEHLPDRVEGMLHRFSRAIRALVHAPVPVIAAIDGRCLGGGFELALAAHLRVVHKDAKLGLPEVSLGVFPPAAVALAAWRGPIVARLAMTGEVLGPAPLACAGVVDRVTDAPAPRDALAWFEQTLFKRSAHAVRCATRACDPGEAFDRALDVAVHRYLGELMEGADASEGLLAFLDKRPPVWSHA